MDAGMFVGIASQRSFFKQMEVIANNIANINTTGYRSEDVDFENLVSSATRRNSGDDTHFPLVARIRSDHSQGILTETGNALDMALTGKGYFALQGASETIFTRDGRISISPFGEVLHISGLPFLDAGGAPILLANPNVEPRIHGDGRLESDGKIIGNIGVFDLIEQNVKARIGNSAFSAKTPPPALALGVNSEINQGFQENSNVDPLRQLARLIAVQRNFEAVSQLVEKSDGALRKSISELAWKR